MDPMNIEEMARKFVSGLPSALSGMRAELESNFRAALQGAAGGFTNSRQLMQMHSDVSGVPITFTEVGDAVVLGGAILAATGAGLFDSVPEAAAAMVHETDTIEPDPDTHEAYRFYVDAYAETYPALRPLVHRSVRVGRRGPAER